MFWQEQDDKNTFQVPDDIVDASFRLRCKSIPLDHAVALSDAVQTAMPWFRDEKDAALHLIYGAASQNGWHRPEGGDGEFHLSRRSRLELRVPVHRIPELEAMQGQEIQVAGRPMVLTELSHRNLNPFPVVFSRHVVSDPGESEDEFMARMAEQLSGMGIRLRKALCGSESELSSASGEPIFTRRLMIADLEKEESIAIQRVGLGEGQKMGLGVFIPHKDISAVSEPS